MRLRTFLGILAALVVVVAVAYLSNQNTALLAERFSLSETASIPVYAALLAAFLLGFLPAVSVLLTKTLQQELAQRRKRKIDREAKSRAGSFRRAVDFEADGLWAKAAAELESCLADRPEDFSTLLRYGEVLRRQGRFDEAVEVHRRASVLYPRSVAVLYQLAADYEARGEGEVAAQIHDRILRDFPGQGLKTLRDRRDTELAGGNWRGAARLHEKIESLGSEGDRADGHPEEDGVRLGLAYQRAVDCLEGDQLAEARRRLEEVLAIEPRFVPGLILRGEISLAAGNDQEAVTAWRKGFETTGSPVFLLRIEDHFIDREKPLEAIETLHRLIADSDNDTLPKFSLGRLYYRLEMHDEALRVLEPMRERLEASPTYHYLLARIHQRRGEAGRAVESYQACVQHAGVAATEFRCRLCDTRYEEWLDRCDVCGSWNAVELDFEEQTLSAEELGLQQAAVRAVYERKAWRSDD